MGVLDTPASYLGPFLRRQRTWEERLAVEGYPFNVQTRLTAGTMSAGQGLGSNSLPGLTRAFWVETLSVTSNKLAVVQVAMSSSALGGNGFAFYWQGVVGPAAPVTVPVRRLLRASAYTSASSFTVTVRNPIDTSASDAYIEVNVGGVNLTDDLNFTADKTMVWLGDSINGGGTGITKKYNQYDWQLRKYFRDAGINIRMVNHSISGTTSQDFETMRLNGWFDHPQVDLLCYSLGMNDAAQSLSAVTYQTDVANAITWKQQRYPNAKMIVFGGTPAENNTTETNAVTTRTNAAAAVTAAADANVKFIDLGSSFDRTQGTTVYASTDPAGSRIHPNDTGHAAVFAVIKTALDAAPTFRP